MKIILNKNNWKNSKDIYFKGFFFFKSFLYKENEAINLIDSQLNRLEDFIKEIDGNYSIIIKRGKQYILVSDILRTSLILYNIDENIITDDIRNLKNLNINETNKNLFILSGFVQGAETLYNNVYQVQAGEIVVLENNLIKRKDYFNLNYKKFSNKNTEEKIVALDKIHIQIFKKLIKTLDGRRVIIPLSGGQDSRLVAVMLKRLNYTNVACFSYGKLNNKESEISKKIAHDLGFKWYFVEHEKEFEKLLGQEEYKQYEKFAGQGISLPHIQDFYAVKKLKEKNILKKGDIFIPGHSYDFLAGSHLLEKFFDLNYKFNNQNLVNEIIKKHYSLWGNKKNKKIIEAQLYKNYIKDNKLNSITSYIEILDLFNLKERQAKFIVNSVKVYEYFGYDWRVPLWDLELIKYWEEIPFKNKLNRKLYFEYTEQTEILRELLKYNIIETLKGKRIRKIINKIPLLKNNIKKIIKIYNYGKDSNNFDKLINKKIYIKGVLKGQENINSFLVLEYLQQLI